MIKAIKKDLYKYWYIIIIAIIYLIVMQMIFSQICPIKILFKMECPGCGITHALYYIITGQFTKACQINWTAYIWLLFAVLFVVDRYIHKLKIKVIPNFFILVCVITILRYIIKLFI